MDEFIAFAMYTSVYSAGFLAIHVIARLMSKRSWNQWDWSVIAWGVLFALFGFWFYVPGAWLAQTLELVKPDRDIVGYVSSIGIPGSVSAVLLMKVWKSVGVAIAVLVATLAAIIISIQFESYGWMIIAPIIWNLIYALTCITLIVRSEVGSDQNFQPTPM